MIQKDWEGRSRIYIPTCDACGTELEPEYDYDDAVYAMRRAGWKSTFDGEYWSNHCPACQMKDDLRGLK